MDIANGINCNCRSNFIIFITPNEKNYNMNTREAIEAKIVDQTKLKYLVNSWKIRGYSVVFTNGCFDILHVGHAHYISEAASLGAFLIVGVNSDDSVKRQGKAENRPINNENSRARIIAGMHGVSAVCIFNDDTPLDLIKLIMPTILVKGGDYDINETKPDSKKYIVGSKEVKATGGKVITVPLVEGYSTTSTINKLTKI
jgi:rfaE bifunctional protein nucleotidyltransferase chain/domain